MIKEKVEDTVLGPAVVKAKLVSLRWSSQVDAELASRSASPPCCLAVHVPPERFTMKVKTAIAAGQLANLAQEVDGAEPRTQHATIGKDRVRGRRPSLKAVAYSRVLVPERDDGNR